MRIVVHNHLTRDAAPEPVRRYHKGRGKPLTFTADCGVECDCADCDNHRVYDRFVARDATVRYKGHEIFESNGEFQVWDPVPRVKKKLGTYNSLEAAKSAIDARRR